MGLDIGEKRIGVALSDETCTIAQAKEVIEKRSDEQLFSRIGEIVSEYNVEEIVIGLPINMNGTYGPAAEKCIQFSERLKKETTAKIKLWDERLSTREADSIMLEASLTRRKRKKFIDRLAAQIILQGYLDSKGNSRS